MSSVVLNLNTLETQVFTLPPQQALVAAHEQSLGNWNTWEYKAPSEYAIEESPIAFYLGDCGVFKKTPQNMLTV